MPIWSTTSADGEYIFREVEGEPLDPDVYLAAHPTWKDPLSLPTSSKEAPAHEGKDKVEDPLTKQGIGKSTLIARLATDWFSDSLTLTDISDGKAGAEKLQGVWIMETGEMVGMRKAEQEKQKA